MLRRRSYPLLVKVTWAALLAAGLMTLVVPGGRPASATAVKAAAAGLGTRAAIAGWQIRDSAAVTDGGDKISRSDFPATGWLAVGPRSTVMAGLVQNGQFPNLFKATNLRGGTGPRSPRPAGCAPSCTWPG